LLAVACCLLPELPATRRYCYLLYAVACCLLLLPTWVAAWYLPAHPHDRLAGGGSIPGFSI
jgi:hypothetical protein